MSEAPADWTSFWDLASPAEAADLFRSFYGSDAAAADAAVQCATAARNDDRASDRQFWLAVAAELSEAGPTDSLAASSTH